MKFTILMNDVNDINNPCNGRPRMLKFQSGEDRLLTPALTIPPMLISADSSNRYCYKLTHL